MNICMTVGTDMSHDARVWKEAKALARTGHQVTVLAANNDALPCTETSDGVHVIRVVPRPLKFRNGKVATSDSVVPSPPQRSAVKRRRRSLLGWMRERLWMLRMLIQLLRHIRHIRPDVIHIHDADRLLIGAIAHLMFRTPFVFDSHEYVAGMLTRDTWRSRILQAWYIVLEHVFLSRASAVITTNNATKEKLAGRYHIRRFAVVHNYPLYQANQGDAGHLRRLVPVEHSHRRLLLFQGRLTAHRGFEVFVKSLALIPDAVGIIIGSGPQEEQLRSLAVDLGLGSRLVFVPQVPWDELAQYTPGADVGFCLTQNTCENNFLAEPNKLFEYLMAGVPVVASDFPGLREVVIPNGVGIVVPPDDPGRIACEVRRMIGDPGQIAAMRGRAQSIARSKFTWEATAVDLIDLYRELEGKFPRNVRPCQRATGESNEGA